MTKNKLRASVTATAVLALAGCLDSNPVEPPLRCELNVNPTLNIAGDTVATGTGLKYLQIVEPDATAAQVQSNSSVDVCYVGFLTNGQVFDARTSPFDLGRNQLIAGFEEGLVGMRVGEARRLIIPPSLGYGSEPRRDANGNVVIPGNSTIIFDVGVLRLR